MVEYFTIGQYIKHSMKNDRRLVLSELQDKYKLKKILEKIGIDNYIKTLYLFNQGVCLEKIRLDLPDKYVIKANNGCGWNIFADNNTYKMLGVSDYTNEKHRRLSNKTYINVNETQINKITEDWTNRNYSVSEWAYSKINPRLIMIEPFIDFNYELLAYCVNGKVRMFRSLLNEHTVNRTSHYYNSDFTSLHDKLIVREPSHKNFEKPTYLNEMKKACEKLLEYSNVKFLRIDFFCNDHTFYISEIALYPQGGNYHPVYDKFLAQFL